MKMMMMMAIMVAAFLIRRSVWMDNGGDQIPILGVRFY